LAVQRVISTAMFAQMAAYRATREQAAQAEQESAKSAADAKTAAEQARRGAREPAVQTEPVCSCRSASSSRSTSR